jgi:hypothetical protein
MSRKGKKKSKLSSEQQEIMVLPEYEQRILECIEADNIKLEESNFL